MWRRRGRGRRWSFGVLRHTTTLSSTEQNDYQDNDEGADEDTYRHPPVKMPDATAQPLKATAINIKRSQPVGAQRLLNHTTTVPAATFHRYKLRAKVAASR